MSEHVPSDRISSPDLPQDWQSGLKLDLALNLLQHAGWVSSDAPEGSTAWMQSIIDGLCDVSSRDALTGLSNRRQFELTIAREVDRVARSGEAALLLVLDIDHFKRVNDTYGHDAGDAVIQAVANTLQDCVRPMDTVARIGGEEFAMILPNCAPAFGETVAERVRTKIGKTAVPVSGGQALSVTVSIGGAFAPQWVRSSSPLWLKRADDKLYEAKRSGRNRTCLEMPAMTSVSNAEKELLFSGLGVFGQSDPKFLSLPLDEPSGSATNLPTTSS